MTEHDDELDRWIHRVVSAAGSDVPDPENLTPRDVSVPTRRRPVAAAAAALVVLGIGGIVWSARGDGPSSAGPTPTGGSPATAPSGLTSLPSSTSSGEPAGTDGATTTVPAAELARPIIDVEWCRPTWARTRDVVFEGAYLWWRQNGLPVQVFVPAGGSLAGPFAVAVRVTANLRFASDTTNTEVSGQPARVSFAKSTWGELLWRLPDGSEAYLRTSTMTSDELVALAATLEPRELDDSLPAFDTRSAAYELVAEAVTPITIKGIVETACEPEGGGWMTATVIDGPLTQALFLTDRPAIPLAVRGLEDGRLLVVTGRDDIAHRSKEVLDSVRDATDDEWAALTAADPNSFEPNTSPDATAAACTGFVPRYIGHGLTAALPDTAQLIGGESTANSGPIPASAGINLIIDGRPVTIGRRVGDDLVPADSVSERADNGVIVFVQAEEAALRTCLLDSTTYDQAMDEQEE